MNVATDRSDGCCWGKTGRIQTRLYFPSILIRISSSPLGHYA
jgi:hypothetical protein